MLRIHRSERADPLADAVGELLADAPEDPFAAEVIAVPTRGIERWLSQRLSTRLGGGSDGGDGICANVRFPSPGVLVSDALARAGDVDPERDPWPAGRMVWPLLGVVERAMAEEWLAPLAAHLEKSPARRFARVRALASLFEEYGFRRPEMVCEWAHGSFDVGDALAWQPQLWMRLREAIAIPSPAERLAPACARLREQPDLVELPERLVVFGVTRLPVAHLEVLDALAQHRDVHLMLLHPSPGLWDRAGEVATNRLLASWGREILDLQQLVGPRAGLDEHHRATSATSPTSATSAGAKANKASSPTLLGALQAGIREDRQPPGAPLLAGDVDARLTLADDDDSVRVHSCHGRARQVEVLREAILHRLAADPTLEPRDVIVMCPDIETFAPLIEATFGEAEGPERTDLRVRLADRSLRQTNPVLGVLARLLELPDGRMTASEVLDLADRAPVRRRFGVDDDDLAQLREWVVAAGVHWGLDAEQRAGFKLGDVDSGTWAFGLRRMLLGVTMSESGDRTYARVLPLDDVPSDEIELAGRAAEFVERLGRVISSLSQSQSVAGWMQTLTSAVDLLTAVPDADAWQRRELDWILADIAADSVLDAAAPELALPEVRALLADRLAGRPTRANFRTGHLTICTLMPMRSVPHRVICLLGLDDGVFPRRSPHDGDNILLADPRPGDRDPRREDRQLLLDALMAARDALIITYTGNDERTNAPRPPAVPVGELLDAIDATARAAAGPARDEIRVVHPLQPFAPENFTVGRLDGDGPWSYDRIALEAARASIATRAPVPAFVEGELPEFERLRTAIALTDLIAFVENPARAFLRQRLGISLAVAEDEVADALPVELDGLASWGVGQRLLEGVLAGAEMRDLALAELARGSLPPGELGRPELQRVWGQVELLAAAAGRYASAAEPRSVETNIVLGDGTRLTGTVSGVREHIALTTAYSRLSARHRLAAWVRLLALTVAHPEIPFTAATIGRAGDPEANVEIATIVTLGADAPTRRGAAMALLEDLVDLYRSGMRRPLALPAAVSWAWVRAIRGGEDPAAAATDAWRSGWRSGSYRRGEDRDPSSALVLGAELPTDDLERFGQRLWAPLVDREDLELR